MAENENNMMTVGGLRERLDKLLLEGAITEDTPVCGFADEFDYVYRLKADTEIVINTEPLIEELSKFVCRHVDDVSWATAVARKKEYIAELRGMGKAVVCLK